jgi:hypothetical protein
MRTTLWLFALATAASAQSCSSSCNYANDGVCDDGGPGAEFDLSATSCLCGTDCGDCGVRYNCPATSTTASGLPPPPPSPSPPSRAGRADLNGYTSCDEFMSAYDREWCEENVAMLPIDAFVGGAFILFLALPHVCFYLGLCCKRWVRRGGSGGDCPFTGQSQPLNVCRVCKTRVGDRAFHRSCSITTESTSGNITTITTTTTHNWDHCIGCHLIKSQGFTVAILILMTGLWGVTLVERALAAWGLTWRDERVSSYGLIPYWLTAVLGLISWAVVWCHRKTLLKFTCLTPCGCCFAASSSSGTSSNGGLASGRSAGNTTQAIVAVGVEMNMNEKV